MAIILHVISWFLFFSVIPTALILMLLQVQSPLLDAYSWWQVLLIELFAGFVYLVSGDHIKPERPVFTKPSWVNFPLDRENDKT